MDDDGEEQEGSGISGNHHTLETPTATSATISQRLATMSLLLGPISGALVAGGVCCWSIQAWFDYI